MWKKQENIPPLYLFFLVQFFSKLVLIFFQNSTYYFYFGYLGSSLADNAKQNTHIHIYVSIYKCRVRSANQY